MRSDAAAFLSTIVFMNYPKKQAVGGIDMSEFALFSLPLLAEMKALNLPTGRQP